MRQTCLCCGYRTLFPVSIFDICEICFWEDDPNCWDNPEKVTGDPNGASSLHQAQKHFVEFQSCDKESLDSVRKPTKEDQRDEKWSIYASSYKRNHENGGLE